MLDKNHLTVDNTQGSYSGYLYSAWSDFGYSDTRITVMRSTDHGESWNSKNEISSGFAASGLDHQGVNLQVGPDGTVYSCWAVRDDASPYTERGIGFNKSTDGGVTWGQAKYAITNIKGMRQNPYPTLGIRTNSFPVMGINMHTGRIYIAWVNVGIPGTNTGDPDIYLIYSDDNGDTWSTPIRVNDDPIDNGALQFHIWLSVDPVTDVLYIAFYDNRENINTNDCEFYIAQTVDDELTFINYPVSDNYFSVGHLPGFWGNYNGEYPGIAARGGKFIPLWHSQVPSANAQGWVSTESNISVTVDQRLSAGQNIGTLRLWLSAEFSDPYSAPQNFPLPLNYEQTFQGSQNIHSNEKYNNWNEFSDVINHYTFLIDQNTTDLYSNFNPTKNGITIKNDLISAPGANPSDDIIEFKDPWLIDYPDPDYGNNKRNRGMKASGPDALIFKERNSPFNPDYSTSYDGDVYQGVFLDQNKEFDPDIPIYSVRAQDPLSAPAHDTNIDWYFQNWEGDNVEFQNASALQTPLVFKAANAEARAVYKGHLASSHSRPSGQPGGRRIAYGYNKLHMVYEDGGQIYYTCSEDDGQTWTKEEMVSDGVEDEDFTYINPSIAVYEHDIYICWAELEEDVQGVFIDYRHKNDSQPENEWDNISYPIGHWDDEGTNAYQCSPVIAVFRDWQANPDNIYPVIVTDYFGSSYYSSEEIYRLWAVSKESGSWQDMDLDLASGEITGSGVRPSISADSYQGKNDGLALSYTRSLIFSCTYSNIYVIFYL